MPYGRAFALGVEEELLLVDPTTHLLAHDAQRLLGLPGLAPDLYLALVESATPICADAPGAIAALAATRARLREAGATVIGAGIHPDGPFGEAPHIPTDRYRAVGDQLRGLARRTPTCALHVHVGMPDEETALRVHNGLREHTPLLTALAANSPFWHGQDSLMASARTAMFRAYPRAEIPPAFDTWAEYEAYVGAVCHAGDLPDYTFLWWDLRPHPRLGTVELRAMDAQSSLRDALGLAGFVHALARAAAAGAEPPWTPRQSLMESSFRAARDGIEATLLHDGTLRPVPDIVAALLRTVDGPGLEEVERIAAANGAARQREAHAAGGMPAVLALLADEAARDPGSG
mgnify:CR=1 FL=1